MQKKNQKDDSQGSSQAATPEVVEAFPHGFEEQEVEITDSPYHKRGEKVKMGKSVAQNLIAKGWAVALSLALFIMAVGFANAQTGVENTFHSTQYVTVALDTVVNAATASVTSDRITGPGTSTTIWITVTKISGTVGGTITLQGSLDGTNWKAINTPNTQTAMATITATDATATYHYWLAGGPFTYYRVSYTGVTGPMSASIGARLMKH